MFAGLFDDATLDCRSDGARGVSLIQALIRHRYVLAFVFAVAFSIAMNVLSREAVRGSFEVSNPAYWTGFEFYYRMAFVFGPSLIIGLIFQRRAGIVAGRAAAIIFLYLTWPSRKMLYTADGEINLQVLCDFFLDGLLFVALLTLVAALVSWLRFKWFPRSRFGAVKWWQILVFFALIFTGAQVFFKGARGLYDEHQLNTVGKYSREIETFIAMDGEDVAYFEYDDGEGFVVENTAPPRLRERFKRGEEVLIRYVPKNPGIYSWEGEDRSGLVYAFWGYVGAGLVFVGLGLLFAWRGRGLLRYMERR